MNSSKGISELIRFIKLYFSLFNLQDLLSWINDKLFTLQANLILFLSPVKIKGKMWLKNLDIKHFKDLANWISMNDCIFEKWWDIITSK